jgi:hemerythrin
MDAKVHSFVARFDESLYRWLKIKAATEDRKIIDIIRQAVQEMKDRETAAK